MVFKREWLQDRVGEVIRRDRFVQVESAVTFRRLTCPRCEFQAIYRYVIQQVRKQAEISCDEEQCVRSDHQEIWKSIPRFAEIPETVKCKKCGEVLGLYPTCLF